MRQPRVLMCPPDHYGIEYEINPWMSRSRGGTPDRAQAQWDRRVALGVVLAAHGYPDNPRKGDEITGIPKSEEDFHVFHAGTELQDGKLLSNGGRVLCVTALGDTVRVAQRRAYQIAEQIQFAGCQMRRDIGQRAIGGRRSQL